MVSPILERLRQRKMVQWSAAYLAGAWLVLQILDLLGGTYDWPDPLLRAIPVLLAFGVPAVLVLAWYHGENGRQRVSGPELLMLAAVLVMAGSGVALVHRVAAPDGADAGGAPRALFTTASADRSIAVLPFANLSSDPQDEYFSDGVTDDIVISLARLSDLKVISRTSAARYKGTTTPIRVIGSELNAAYVLEGSVRRVGDQVRITTKLTDARTEQHLWAETYDRELEDILALQSEIAARVSTSLRATLSPDEQRRLASSRSRPAVPAAYEAYLRGRAGQQSTAAYEEAIALDPDFAPAYAALAIDAYLQLFFGFLPPAEAYARMESHARGALARDPDLAEGHAARALLALHRDWDWEAAERHFRRALQLRPNDPGLRHFYAHYLLAMGRNAESAAETQWAAELAPFDAGLTACSGWHGLSDRQHRLAVDRSIRALQLQPEFFWAEMILGWAYEDEGRHAEAIGAFRGAVAHSGGSVLATASLGHALAASGELAQARAVLAELLERRRDGYVSPYDVAAVYAGLGDRDAAFRWLREARTERSAFVVNLGWDPRFRGLRDDPRFAELVRSMRLPRAPGKGKAPRAGAAQGVAWQPAPSAGGGRM